MIQRRNRLAACRMVMAITTMLLTDVQLSTLADAADFEVQPAYGHSRSLRGESRLNAIAFATPRIGLAVGDRGAILRTEDGGDNWILVESKTSSRLESVAWSSPTTAIVVGGGYDRVTGISRGIVLRTNDGGQTWQRSVAGELPKIYEVAFDHAERRWTARGDFSFADLTTEFESGNGGQTWTGSGNAHDGDPNPAASIATPGDTNHHDTSRTARRLAQWIRSTPARAAMRCLTRVDSRTLIAAGNHGVILRSTDEGETWTVVRGQGRSSAVLVITSQPDRTPWQLIAVETLEHQRRLSVLWIDAQIRSQDSRDRQIPVEVDRLHQAVTAIGCDGIDRCAATGTTTASIATGPSDDELRNWLIASAPLVVAVDRAVAPKIQQRIMELAVQLGIPRIVGFAPNRRGDTLLHENALLPRAGTLAADIHQDAAMIVSADSHGRPNLPKLSGATASRFLAIDWLYDSTSSATRGESLTSGLRIQPGHTFETVLPSASRRDVQFAQAKRSLTQKLTQVIGTANRSKPPTQELTIRQALDAILPQIERDHHLRTLLDWFQRSDQTHFANARSESCRTELLSELAFRFEDDTVGKLAAVILERHSASREHHHLRAATMSLSMPTDSSAIRRVAASSPPVSPFEVQSQATQASVNLPVESTGSNIAVGMFQPRSRQSTTTAKQSSIRNTGVRLFQNHNETEPTMERRLIDLQWDLHPLKLIVAESQRQFPADVSADVSEDVEVEPSASWQHFASPNLSSSGASTWSHLFSTTPTTGLVSMPTDSRPKLDGQVTDSVWSSSREVTLETGVRLQVAHDERFLYLVATCPKLQPSSLDETKPRDNDLDDADRLSLRFDIDRDLLTSYELEVTADRLTRDAVDGDTRWQPSWFVAQADLENATRFEIAITRQNLEDFPGDPTDNWYFSAAVQRAGTRRSSLAIPDPSEWTTLRFDTSSSSK